MKRWLDKDKQNSMENRNPYHNYDDLPIIDWFYHKIKTDYENGELILPNIYGTGYKKWDEYNYSRQFGFNTCLTKEELEKGYSFPSKIWTGELIDYTYQRDGRLKKDGTPYQRKKGNPIYNSNSNTWTYNTQIGVMEYISTDIQSFWEYLNFNRQVSCGLTHNDRFVVVGDFDSPFTNNTIKELEEICSRSGIPHFTYLEEHLDTEHFQIGWILDEPFSMRYIEKKTYNQITKYVSEIFGSDRYFTGWNIKNPNCLFNTRTFWFNDTINKQELIQSLKNTHNEYFNTPFVKEQIEKPVIEPVVVNDYKPSSYVNDKTSRNCSLFNELHKWMMDYVRNNGELPSKKESWKQGYEISVSLGRLTHKGTLPDYEILSVIRSVERYIKEIGTETGYSKRQRFGNLVLGSNKESKILDVYYLWKMGYKTGEIQKELGLKRDVLNKYIRYVKDNKELIETGDYQSVIPRTMELSKMSKTEIYNRLVNDVFGKLSTIKKMERNTL